jgi:hypothetical protein
MHAQRPIQPWKDKFLRSGFFFGAVLFHLVVFLMVATLVIWPPTPPPQNDTFQAVSIKPPPPPPPEPPSHGGAARNPQLEPQPVVVPVVTPPTALTSVADSAFKFDVSKSLATTFSHLSEQVSAGSGSDTAGAGTTEGPGSFFGEESQGSSLGFAGNFFDFTRSQEGKATGIDEPAYAKIVVAFGKAFQPPDGHPCYTSSTTLYSKFFFFPPIPDHDAGTAFKTPSSTEAFWIAHYHGSFTADHFGEYRFVGFGDNVCEVRINDRIVLEASDHGYFGGGPDYSSPARKHVGDISLSGKNGTTPVYEGDSFRVDPGDSVHFDIAVGDEGGIFCSGLFIVPKDTTIAFTSDGIPKLPLFVIGRLGDEDKKLLGQYLPAECLGSPVNFSAVTETLPSY